MPHKTDVPSLWCPEMGAVVARQQELAGDAYSTNQSIEDMRAAYAAERSYWNEGGPVMAETLDAWVPTSHGDVSVRLYRPFADDALPCIVFAHGGGWVVGSPDTHDRITRALARQSGAAVVSVDYTLSPEARYPQAIEECAGVVGYLQGASEAWGLNADDISLAGDSAGASLMLGAWMHLRETDGATPAVTSLLLFYGAYGLRDSMSMRLLGGPWDGLSESDWLWYLGLYLNAPDDICSPGVNLLDQELGDLPPCFIASAGLDPLKDDSATLAALLENAGRPHRYIEVPGVIHGFLHHSRMLTQARQVISASADFYRQRRAGR